MERLLILFHKLALHPLPHGSKNYFVFIKFSLSERIFYFVVITQLTVRQCTNVY